MSNRFFSISRFPGLHSADHLARAHHRPSVWSNASGVVVFDLSSVTEIDSGGTSLLMAAHSKLAERGLRQQLFDGRYLVEKYSGRDQNIIAFGVGDLHVTALCSSSVAGNSRVNRQNPRHSQLEQDMNLILAGAKGAAADALREAKMSTSISMAMTVDQAVTMAAPTLEIDPTSLLGELGNEEL